MVWLSLVTTAALRTSAATTTTAAVVVSGSALRTAALRGSLCRRSISTVEVWLILLVKLFAVLLIEIVSALDQDRALV